MGRGIATLFGNYTRILRPAETSGCVRVRVNAHVAASARVGRSAVDLPQGLFAATLVGLRLDWSFTPRMF